MYVEERARLGRKLAETRDHVLTTFNSAIEGGQLPLSPVSSAKFQAQRLFDSNRGVQPSEKRTATGAVLFDLAAVRQRAGLCCQT
jgi:hypothetical protein